MEALEDRTLPSIYLNGVPSWIEQGPGPIQTPLSLYPTVAGAINAIAPDPTNANRVFVATVNGGIWRTDDATDSSPFWIPLTDQYPSLSMGAIAFSPLDPTLNTLFAGTGHFSSGGRDGGPLTGVLRTTDGGNTWTMLGLGGQDIENIVPTSLTVVYGGQVVLAGTAGGGVFRSVDGGRTWIQISGATGSGLPAGGVSALVPDQSISDALGGLGHPSRFYAAVPGQGIFGSDDWGATWVSLTNGNFINANGFYQYFFTIINSSKTNSSNTIRLSIHHDSSGNNFLWAGIIHDNHVVDILGSSDPNGALSSTSMSWGALPQPGGLIQQDDLKFQMVADATDWRVVFVSGDSNGFPPIAPVLRWEPLFGFWDNVSGYGPHPDSRGMVFDHNGNILECDDGGIYRLNGPDNVLGLGRGWSSVNGNIRPTEFYSVAYDPINNVIIGGAQDNGSPAQQSPGSTPWGWVNGGDGGFAQIATEYATSDTCFGFPPVCVSAGSLFSDWYTFADGAGSIASGANFLRYVVIPGMPGNVLALPPSVPQIVGLHVEDPSGAPLAGLLSGFPDRSLGHLFFLPYVLNAVDPTRMLVGTDYLYESRDRGDDLLCLDGLIPLGGGLFAPANPVGAVDPSAKGHHEGDPMAYGGISGGVPNPDVIWVGTGTGLRLRTSGLGLPKLVPNYPGGVVQAIALDPTDWHSAFIVDADGRIWNGVTNDNGSCVNWTQLTGNLSSFTADLRTIAVYRDSTGSNLALLVGSGQGGVYRTINPPPTINPTVLCQSSPATASPTWSKFGIDLPNAPVTTLRYDVANDVLLAGTFGRGAWTIPNLSASVLTPGTLQIDGDTGPLFQEDIRLVRDANNPLLLDVSEGGTEFASLPFASVQQIIVNGLSANVILNLDLRNGNVIPSMVTGAYPLTINGCRALTIYDTAADTSNAPNWTVTNSTLTRLGPIGSSSIYYNNVESLGISINVGNGLPPLGRFSGLFTGTPPNLAISGFAQAALDVQGNLYGTFWAPTVGTQNAPIDHIYIHGSMLAGSRIKVNYLNTLSVTGDLAGKVNGYGNSGSPGQPTIGQVTIGGNFTGTITAPVIQSINMQPASSFSGHASETAPGADFQSLLLGTVTSTAVINAGSIVSAIVAGDMAGQIAVSGPLGTLTLGGNLSGSLSALTIGSLSVGQNLSGSVSTSSIGSLMVGQDLAGQVVTGPLATLSVGGNLSGSVSATMIGSLIVGQNLTGSVTASQSIGTLSVGGDTTGTIDTPAIASVTVNGTIHDDTFVITPTSVELNGQTVLSATFQSLTVNGRGGNDLFIISGGPVPATLNGGDGNDTFRITTGASITGTIDGGGGINTLDYTAYTGDVMVDLPLGIATAVGGGVANIQNVLGSIGNDLLVGNALANVLTGGTGRNFIIGGSGADEIVGGGGDNILIGGTTVYDTNLVALAAIMNEWTRTDLSFHQRLADLISNAPPARALNGPYHLNKKTVIDDGAKDTLIGGGGLDWFFADLAQDRIENRKAGDHITRL